MTVRYERNSAGLQQLLMSDDMGDCMTGIARVGVAYAETIAPRRSNQYAENIVVAPGADASPTPRRVASIVALVDYAWKVEQKHGTLGKVADALEAGTLR